MTTTVPPVLSLNIGVTIPLKYLSNFRRILDLPLINCEIEFAIPWTKDCVLSEHHSSIRGETFQINNAELYLPLVTLSINNDIKFSENKKQGMCNHCRN